jgi:YwiC-like protein
MSLPLATSLLVSGVTIPALLVAVIVIAGFLGHEPLLLLLGQRGGRARREQGRRAIVWLIATTAITVAAGLSLLSMVPSEVRWSLLLPLVPVAPLAWFITRRQEKSAAAEIAVALAFSLFAVPVCLAAGASTQTALAIATAFASIFVTATLAVRVVVLRVRGGGHGRAAAATRMTTLVLITAITAGLIATAIYGWTPWVTGEAAAPGLVVAGWLALFPPSPTRLRMVGWTLVATSIAAAVILVAAL